MMTTLQFNDESLSSSFEKDGYVIVRGGSTESLAALSVYISSQTIRLKDSIYYSLMSNTFEDNKQIAFQVRTALDGILSQLFASHTLYNPSFLIKPPRIHQEFMLHQDWCFTDTDLFQMGTVWVPLCDVDETNGCLTVVPKSHRAFRTFISGNLQTARIPMSDMSEAMVRPLPMRLGDVLIFNPLVFHGSFPNNSERPRTIATVNVLPKNAPFCYYHQRSYSETDRVTLQEDTVLKGLPNLVEGIIPNDAERETVSYTHSIPTVSQLTDQLAQL